MEIEFEILEESQFYRYKENIDNIYEENFYKNRGTITSRHPFEICKRMLLAKMNGEVARIYGNF